VAQPLGIGEREEAVARVGDEIAEPIAPEGDRRG
jgi:hypothetical protein